MKRRDLVAGLAFALATIAVAPLAAKNGPSTVKPVFIGTHGTGPGQGIFAARFDSATGRLTVTGLAAEIERPTWLVPGDRPGVVYAVSETGNDGKSEAQVYALRVDPSSNMLSVIDHVGSGGGGATHLAFHSASQTLFVANYGTGQVSALPVRGDGGLAPAASVVQDLGSGPHRRQTAPHAHGALPSPDGRFLLVTDLGADRIFIYKFDRATRALTPNVPPFAAAAAGSGPRHMVFLPNGRFAYADSELTGEITGYRWAAAAGALTSIETISAVSPSYAGDKSAAEIATSRDGRFLYVSTRGEDAIVAYRIDGTTGRLSEVQRVASGGKVPWSFTIDPTGRWMLVANEASSSITVFRIDRTSGRMTSTGQSVAVGKPVSIAFPR